MIRASTFSLMALAAAGCTTGWAVSPPDRPTAEVGQPAPDFTLSDLSGAEHSLSDLEGKTVVLEWFNPGCPFVQHAHGRGGALQGLASRATAAADVVWLAINSGAKGKQGHGSKANTSAKAEWAMSHPILIDEDGTVGRRYGAVTTPHMYVVDAEGVLVYQGAIDNKPLGKGDGAKINYVERALADLAADRVVATPATKPYGCSVKY